MDLFVVIVCRHCQRQTQLFVQGAWDLAAVEHECDRHSAAPAFKIERALPGQLSLEVADEGCA